MDASLNSSVKQMATTELVTGLKAIYPSVKEATIAGLAELTYRAMMVDDPDSEQHTMLSHALTVIHGQAFFNDYEIEAHVIKLNELIIDVAKKVVGFDSRFVARILSQLEASMDLADEREYVLQAKLKALNKEMQDEATSEERREEIINEGATLLRVYQQQTSQM